MNIPEKHMEINKSIFGSSLPFSLLFDAQTWLSLKYNFLEVLTTQLIIPQNESVLCSHNIDVTCLTVAYYQKNMQEKHN